MKERRQGMRAMVLVLANLLCDLGRITGPLWTSTYSTLSEHVEINNFTGSSSSNSL